MEPVSSPAAIPAFSFFIMDFAIYGLDQWALATNYASVYAPPN